MWKLRRFLAAYKKELILGPAFKFTEAVLELAVPVIMARIIDVGVKNRDTAYIMKMGLLLVVLGAAGLGCASVCQYYASAASQGSGTALRSELFAKIMTLSQAELDRFGTNRLTAALTGDTYALQLAVAMLIRLVVRSPFIAAGAAAAAAMIDLRLSVVIFCTLPLLAFAIYFIMSRTVPYYRNIRGSLDRVARITRENLTGLRVVRAFSKEEYEKKRFAGAGEEHAVITVAAARLSSLLNPLTYVIMNLGVAGIIYIGGFRVNSGSLTQGELIAFINYITQIMLAVVVIAGLVVTFTRASASAARINEIFETVPSVDPGKPDTAKGGTVADTAVRFRGVTFGYGGGAVLRDINLSIPRGATLGIVGGTGSGKSTLARLIMRFYDTQDGAVEVDGTDVRNMSVKDLREKIGYVPQRAELIAGTIADNIRMGDAGITDADIERALRTAQAEFVFAMEKGIMTEAVQDGRGMSGGQRQRITIARALVRRPRILIFDDCLSSLDAETARLLRLAVAKEHPEATKIIISQRASAIKNADLIAVMEDGVIAGAGTHEELLESCAVYAEIVSIGNNGAR